MLPEIPAAVLETLGTLGVGGDWAELPSDPVFCGVYLLLSAGEVVYVGQSIDVIARCRSHLRRRQKEFDRVVYFRCDELDLDALEEALIVALKPKCNSHAFPARGRRKHIAERRRLLTEAREVKNL